MKLRSVLVALGLVALAVLIIINKSEINEAWRLLPQVRWQLLLLVPLVQLLSFSSNALYYRSFLSSFGYQAKFRDLLEISFALNFVNQMLPSAGLSSATFLSYALKPGVPAGKATFVQMGRYVLAYLTYSVLLMLAIGFLYFGGGINKLTVRLVIVLVAGIFLASVAVILAMRRRAYFNMMVKWVQIGIDWVSRRVFRLSNPVIGQRRVERILDEFHDGFDLAMRERKRLKMPLLFSLCGNLAELTTLYIAFVAFGEWVNLGAVILSYAAANAVGVISVIPGDIGVYEVAIIAAFTATGIPAALALSATLVYRIFNKALLLPVGFYFYTKYVKRIPVRGSPRS